MEGGRTLGWTGGRRELGKEKRVEGGKEGGKETREHNKETHHPPFSCQSQLHHKHLKDVTQTP